MRDLLLGPLTPAAILAVWERAAGATQPRRALALLAAASPLPAESFVRLPLGRRDAALLRVRSMTFGPRSACVESCSRCGLRLEFELDVDRLLELGPHEEGGDELEPLTVRGDAGEWRARLPTTADLEDALAGPGDPRETLVRACLLDGDEPTAQLVSAFDRACAEADPLADIRFTLACTACGSSEEVVLDPATLLWDECVDSAGRLLEDVHHIASRYHWPEERILALPATRRRFYLSRIAQSGVR